MRGRLIEGSNGPGGMRWVLVTFDARAVCRHRNGYRWGLGESGGRWTFRSELAARRFAKRKNIQLEEPT